jgi:hypothetical protein
MTCLTKSRFLSGLQCHKRLWFEIHEPLDEAVEPGVPILQGRAFDEAVQGLHPGVVISRSNGMLSAIAETQRVLAQGSNAPSPLYQPAFRAGDLTVITDVLRRRGDSFELVEVKATTQAMPAESRQGQTIQDRPKLCFFRYLATILRRSGTA